MADQKITVTLTLSAEAARFIQFHADKSGNTLAAEISEGIEAWAKREIYDAAHPR